MPKVFDLEHQFSFWPHEAPRDENESTARLPAVAGRFAGRRPRRFGFSVQSRLSNSDANRSQASAIRSNPDREASSTESFHISRQRFAQS
jgi:hypothetical protein